ncbi:MAG TPA: sialidase family protein, partial [Anaerolineales bacterium]
MLVCINRTTAPSTLNDKEWIAADWHTSSQFMDRVYVSWTRFIFNPHNGNYVQSPIFFAYSTDGGQTFSDPTNITGNVKYDQGSRPIVGYVGIVHVIFEGLTRLAPIDSTGGLSATRTNNGCHSTTMYSKSSDGGATWST